MPAKGFVDERTGRVRSVSPPKATVHVPGGCRLVGVGGPATGVVDDVDGVTGPAVASGTDVTELVGAVDVSGPGATVGPAGGIGGARLAGEG